MSPIAITLNQARAGDTVMIGHIDAPEAAMMALRMGIAEGETVEVVARIPGGPLVLRHGSMEIALGRDVCRSIPVYPIQTSGQKPSSTPASTPVLPRETA